MSQEGIHTVPLGAVETSIAALKSRQVDAVVLSTEVGFGLEERKEGRFTRSDGSLRAAFITHVVFAQKSIVASKPGIVERFLKGFFEAITYESTSR